eukprot:scaffold576_cov260-Pinguiococcus_pyrenoidosus.AAC.33
MLSSGSTSTVTVFPSSVFTMSCIPPRGTARTLSSAAACREETPRWTKLEDTGSPSFHPWAHESAKDARSSPARIAGGLAREAGHLWVLSTFSTARGGSPGIQRLQATEGALDELGSLNGCSALRTLEVRRRVGRRWGTASWKKRCSPLVPAIFESKVTNGRARWGTLTNGDGTNGSFYGICPSKLWLSLVHPFLSHSTCVERLRFRELDVRPASAKVRAAAPAPPWIPPGGRGASEMDHVNSVQIGYYRFGKTLGIGAFGKVKCKCSPSESVSLPRDGALSAALTPLSQWGLMCSPATKWRLRS